jgi:hypothetical protein
MMRRLKHFSGLEKYGQDSEPNQTTAVVMAKRKRTVLHFPDSKKKPL